MKTLIVDANVIAKMFVEEDDSQQAIDFLRGCVAKNIQVQAPELVKYEIAQIALKKKYNIDDVMGLFEDNIETLVEICAPDRQVWKEAEKICQHGHVKSGYPSMYDSVYHAMAIIKDGTFITADKRHYEKAKSFGHISLLKDWESIA